MTNILITGGAGFIASNFINQFVTEQKFHFVNLDKLTYAGDLNNIEVADYNNYSFVKGDICDENLVKELFDKYQFQYVFHFAAESHVDNSIKNANIFVETNVMGTLNLLNAAKNNWENKNGEHVFYHISTDEVYGHLEADSNPFTENTPYDPRSPYSASKASSDHFVRAFFNTYELPTIISNCSNNYGERQHVEKLLPKTITNLLTGKKIPVYGRGENIRDWLYVKDHVKAIDKIFHEGEFGETYNIGGDSEISNIDIVKMLIDIHIQSELKHMHGVSAANYDEYIEFVADRKGHDFRYAINHDKLTHDIGWKPEMKLYNGLEQTYKYYKSKLKY